MIRGLLETATAAGAATLAGLLGAARAQPASKTLVIAAPATPQGLDMEYDISLGSIDAMGGLYDGLLAYVTMPDPDPDPDAPGVMREA